MILVDGQDFRKALDSTRWRWLGLRLLRQRGAALGTFVTREPAQQVAAGTAGAFFKGDVKFEAAAGALAVGSLNVDRRLATRAGEVDFAAGIFGRCVRQTGPEGNAPGSQNGGA